MPVLTGFESQMDGTTRRIEFSPWWQKLRLQSRGRTHDLPPNHTKSTSILSILIIFSYIFCDSNRLNSHLFQRELPCLRHLRGWQNLRIRRFEVEDIRWPSTDTMPRCRLSQVSDIRCHVYIYICVYIHIIYIMYIYIHTYSYIVTSNK